MIEEGRKTLHISVPSKSIDITVDKKQGELRVNADGKRKVGKCRRETTKPNPQNRIRSDSRTPDESPAEQTE